MSGYDFERAERVFRGMDDGELYAARMANIERRDRLDTVARRADAERARALAALKAAQSAYDAADAAAREAERAYSFAADDCCAGATEAYRRANEARERIESARRTLATCGGGR